MVAFCVRAGCGVQPTARIHGKWSTFDSCPTHLAHVRGFLAPDWSGRIEEIAQVLPAASR